MRKHTAKFLIAALAATVWLSAHGQNSSIVNATPTKDQSNILIAVDEFKSLLTTAQMSTVQVDFTAANAAKWSNLPVGAATRNGLMLGDLTADQQAAALRIAELALSADGYERLKEIRAADDYLNSIGGATTGGTTSGPGTGGGPGGDTGGGPGGGTGGGPGGDSGGGTGGGGALSYSSGNYFIAFLGTPSATTPWMLQIGGHHLAYNIAFNGAKVSTTPYFVGVEPQSFTTVDGTGTTYTPLASKKSAMFNLVNSLSTAQLAQAKLSSSFSDVYLGPGQDGKSKFPTQQGIKYSALTAAQQALVKTAIAAWTSDGTAGSTYQTIYERGLASTYVAWSGSDTTLNTQGDYVRIDGPRCWIEFVCQNGIVVQNQIHFHTVWRDKTSDYGSNFTF